VLPRAVQLQGLLSSYKDERAAGDKDPDLLLRLRDKHFPDLPALNATEVRICFATCA
jgi:hypothetical protein